MLCSQFPWNPLSLQAPLPHLYVCVYVVWIQGGRVSVIFHLYHRESDWLIPSVNDVGCPNSIPVGPLRG